ncbi:hypothetical protein, partial [Microvirga aerilata]
ASASRSEGAAIIPRNLPDAPFSATASWCGKPLGLSPCVDEIIQVEKDILSRDKRAYKTGIGYNAGSSLVGCRIYCTVRHFAHDTPDECKVSVATFEKEAARKPYLWRTNLRLLLMEKCEIPF